MSSSGQEPKSWTSERAHITTLSPQDAREIADLWQPIFGDIYPNEHGVTREMFEGDSFNAQLAAYLGKRLKEPSVSLVAARCDDAIVGTIGLEILKEDDRHLGDIWGFYVASRLQGHGFGRLLWSTIMDEVATLKLDSLTLTAVEGSDRAIAFYEQNGFTRVKQETQQWPDWLDNKVENGILIMERPS